jgi:hypothetical protein
MIIRTKKNQDYFVASNKPFNNSELSWEARGILGYLFSKPDGWTIRNGDLYKQSPAGRQKVDRILSELKRHGYLVREKTRQDNGTLTWESVLYEIPPTIPPKANVGSANDGSANVGSANVGKPGYIVSTELINTESIKKDSSPSAKRQLSDYQEAIKELSKVFASVRKCELPDWENDPKGSNKTWGTPLGIIWKKCDKDLKLAANIVTEATKHMVSARLTLVYPVQILTVAESMILDRKSNVGSSRGMVEI